MQKTGLHRNTKDKYYTKSHIVNYCLQAIKERVVIQDNDVIIEPSAGNGAFSDPLSKSHNNVLAYDIEPDNDGIIQQDYLTFGASAIKDKYDKIHIIGNPPFGRQSSLARKFIKKSCEFCDTLSFVLPKSFKKDSFQKTFPLHFHLMYQVDLPEKSFQVNSKDYDVPCVFQIWIKKDEPRPVKEKLHPTYYSFVKKDEGGDISLRRVGVYAGKISTEIESKSPQSHYFIRLKEGIHVNTFVDEYNKKVQFDHENTVGPKSISKQELIEQLNVLFKSPVQWV